MIVPSIVSRRKWGCLLCHPKDQNYQTSSVQHCSRFLHLPSDRAELCIVIGEAVRMERLDFPSESLDAVWVAAALKEQ